MARRRQSAVDLARRVVGRVMSHPGNNGRVPQALMRSLGWQVWKRVARRPLYARLEGGISFCLFPDAGSASNVVYFDGRFDFAETRFLARYLRPGDEFWDVGANIGYFTLLAGVLVGSAGKVRAFEPLPTTFRMLERNVSLNPALPIEAHAVALAADDARAWFTADMDVSNRLTTDKRGDVVQVVVSRVDAWPSAAPTFVKVDVEGAELEVLRGAESTVRRCRPVLQVELIEHLLRDRGASIDGVAHWSGVHGYRMFLPTANGDVEPLASISAVKGNVLLLPAERLDEVRRRLTEAPHVNANVGRLTGVDWSRPPL
jgi:FkbM family methyltransferase